MALLLRSIPIVAFVPIIVRIAGYGTHTVLVVTTVLSFFPCYVFALSGFQEVAQVRKDFCRSVGCRIVGWRFFRYVAMPTAVPNILTALRVLAPTALLVALVAEFLIGADGLGYVMLRARSDLEMDKSWAAALLASVLSVAFFALFSWFDKKYRSNWQA
jgi:NitT/TauT family transport system permease protein